MVSRSEGEQESRKKDRAKERRHKRGETDENRLADPSTRVVPAAANRHRRPPSRSGPIHRSDRPEKGLRAGPRSRENREILVAIPFLYSPSPFLLSLFTNAVCKRWSMADAQRDRPIIHAPPGEPGKPYAFSRRKRWIAFSRDG